MKREFRDVICASNSKADFLTMDFADRRIMIRVIRVICGFLCTLGKMLAAIEIKTTGAVPPLGRAFPTTGQPCHEALRKGECSAAARLILLWHAGCKATWWICHEFAFTLSIAFALSARFRQP